MSSESASARNAVGVSEMDILAMKKHARRRMISLLLVGGIGTVAALAAGYLSARYLYCELRSNEWAYPLITPLVAVGIADRKRTFGIVGIVVSTIAAYTLMFVLTAAECPLETQPTAYGVWGRE